VFFNFNQLSGSEFLLLISFSALLIDFGAIFKDFNRVASLLIQSRRTFAYEMLG
jgi:hypothetical protein